MANSIYQQLNNNSNNNLINNFPNPQNLINQFNNFRRTLQGDPQQMVMQLLRNGTMSQQDYNNLRQMAQQFQQLLGQY